MSGNQFPDGMMTNGQLEAVACVAAGMTNESAAAFLGVSVETVRSQIQNAFNRITPRPKTRGELVALGVAYGWFHPCLTPGPDPELRIYIVPEHLRRKRWDHSEWWKDPTTEGAQLLVGDLSRAYPTIPSAGVPVVAPWTNEASLTVDGFEGEGA